MSNTPDDSQYRQWVADQLESGAGFRVWAESPDIADFHSATGEYLGSVPARFIW